MITAAGCKSRRQRFLGRFKPTGPVLFTDPLSLRYFINFYVDPISISADYGGVLRLDPDGKASLWFDKRVPKESAAAAFVDEATPLPWYDGKSPGQGPRRLILRDPIIKNGGRVIDDLAGPDSVANAPGTCSTNCDGQKTRTKWKRFGLAAEPPRRGSPGRGPT